MDSFRSEVRRRDVAGLYFNGWTREPVCELLDSPRGPTSGLGPTGKEFGAVKMAILTPEEKEFLDVFLHEATTSPFFDGPATKALYAIGVEYSDISYIAWAYEQDVPRTRFEIGHSAEVSPPLPWPARESVSLRNEQIQRIWNRLREPAHTSNA